MQRKTYITKLLWFCSFLVAGFLLVIVRLVDIQIVQGADLLEKANANRFFSVRIPAERGVIYDRYSQALTFNKPRYYRLTNPEQLYTQRVAISSEEALQLKATDSAHLTYDLERGYVYPEILAHLIGYTSAVNKEELLADSSLHPQDITGKLGLEKSFEQLLRGKSGSDVFEVDAFGKRQRLVEKKTGMPGNSVYTSIDPYISQVAFQALADKKGAVIVLDADTAEVLTLVSTPSYNSMSLSSQEIDQNKEKARKEKVQQFFADENKVFFNRAVSGAYPPGSVFKLITALAGLEENAFSSETVVVDEGSLKVGEYSYANWYYRQYGSTDGPVNVQKAIARSNDIFFYKAAEWIGPQQLADVSRIFGLGSRTKIDILGEVSGLVPDPKWKEQTIGEKWYLGNTYHFGIGQADLLVTPIQVAQYTQALAHNGTMCQPHVVSKPVIGSNSGSCKEVGIHKDNLQVVLNGMLDACSDGGTAFPFFEHNRQYRPAQELDPNLALKSGAVACKTGTAEFGEADEVGYRKTHGWFTSIIDTESLLEQRINQNIASATPSAVLAENQDLEYTEWLGHIKKYGFPKRLAVVVLVESDETQKFREGSRDAAPVAKSILDWMLGKSTEVPTEVEGEGE